MEMGFYAVLLCADFGQIGDVKFSTTAPQLYNISERTSGSTTTFVLAKASPVCMCVHYNRLQNAQYILCVCRYVQKNILDYSTT